MADGIANLRQASIVSVDLFGFARATEEDREKVANAFEALTARLEATAVRHSGRVFNSDADGFFLELPTPEAALAAGDEIANGPWPPVRVGVHQGAVSALFTGQLSGEAISTAAHIQQAADKGVVLVSDEVRKSVRDPAITKRLIRDTASVGTTPVYRLAFQAPVDEAALKQSNRRLILSLAGGAAIVTVLVGVFFGRDIYTTLFPKHDHVAVLALKAKSGGKDAQEFADGLTDEIAYTLNQGKIPTVVGKVAESLRGPDHDAQARRYQVGAVLDGSVSGDANGLSITLRIDDPVHHQTIWTHDFRGAGEDLQTQVSSRVISILTCASRALQPGPSMASGDIEALYLKSCDLDLDAAGDANAQVAEEQALRQLVAKAPDFSYGHSSLALFLFGKSQVDPTNATALLAESAREAEKAIALDPKNSEAYAARARLVPPPGWPEREKNLALAVTQPGAGLLPNAIYALMLGEVGRLNEAAVYAQKVASEDSGDPDYVSLIATSLAAQGKDDDADRALTRALQIAPTNPVNQAFRFHMYEWFGRWDEALRILEDDANRSPLLTQEEDLAAGEAFIKAMATDDPSARATARDAEFVSVSHDRAHLMVAISHLSALGLVDDAYRLAAQVPPSAQQDDLSVLFTPLNAQLRRDPRFIALAAKVGLVGYWTASGKWPDFCSAPDLGYNCKVEAQKVASK